jgi:hypothetical protein
MQPKMFMQKEIFELTDYLFVYYVMLDLNKCEPLPDFSCINKKLHRHDDQTDHLLLWNCMSNHDKNSYIKSKCMKI